MTQRTSTAAPVLSIEQLSPDLARSWLEGLAANRRISQRKVDQYARDIVAGRWNVNGETIKFDRNGQMIDGQHRCWAVIESDKSIRVIVCRGLGTDARETVDTGRARTMRDVLSMRGESHTQLMAGAATWLWRWGSDQWALRANPSHLEAMATIEGHPGLRSSVDFVFKSGSFRSSMFVVVHYIGMMANSAAADEFIVGVFNGVSLSAGDPRLVLRDRLLADKGNKAKLPAKEVAALIIKGWNHYVAGKSVRNLRWRELGPTAEPFPTIDGSQQLRRRLNRKRSRK